MFPQPGVLIVSYPDPAYAIHDRNDTRRNKFACFSTSSKYNSEAKDFDHNTI